MVPSGCGGFIDGEYTIIPFSRGCKSSHETAQNDIIIIIKSDAYCVFEHTHA